MASEIKGSDMTRLLKLVNTKVTTLVPSGTHEITDHMTICVIYCYTDCQILSSPIIFDSDNTQTAY